MSVNKLGTHDYNNNEVVDQPLVILFALDQVAAAPHEGLGVVIDAENAGVTGYSLDGLNALMMSGARVDADFYLNHCATLDRLNPPPSEFKQKYWCDLREHWAEFKARAGVN